MCGVKTLTCSDTRPGISVRERQKQAKIGGCWEMEDEVEKLGVTCLGQLLALTVVLYSPATTAPSFPSFLLPTSPLAAFTALMPL